MTTTPRSAPRSSGVRRPDVRRTTQCRSHMPHVLQTSRTPTDIRRTVPLSVAPPACPVHIERAGLGNVVAPPGATGPAGGIPGHVSPRGRNVSQTWRPGCKPGHWFLPGRPPAAVMVRAGFGRERNRKYRVTLAHCSEGAHVGPRASVSPVWTKDTSKSRVASRGTKGASLGASVWHIVILVVPLLERAFRG